MNRSGLMNVIVVAAVLVCGCAKQPAMSLTSAPAPTGTTAPMSPAPSSQAAAPPAVTGSPASRPAPSEFAAVREVEDIHFDFDKYAIRPDDAQILDRSARWLTNSGNDLLLIEGHCDERGTSEYNLALGDRRAKATMNYLVTHGIAARRISTISYGKERPQCTDHNEACWAKNRRAHFLVKRG